MSGPHPPKRILSGAFLDAVTGGGIPNNYKFAGKKACEFCNKWRCCAETALLY
jgi:hypothetical protein